MDAAATVRERNSGFCHEFEAVKREIGLVVVGHEALIEQVFIALVCGGHCLLEGVPGLGKTLLVRTLGDILNLTFSRIQFTPDLMPADITGTNVLLDDPSGRKILEFQRGPVFAHIVLADEINRATPKTQSALLEAMQERSVTVGGGCILWRIRSLSWRRKTRSRWKEPIRCRKLRLTDFSSSCSCISPAGRSWGGLRI